VRNQDTTESCLLLATQRKCISRIKEATRAVVLP
jgi:hypothetical protein